MYDSGVGVRMAGGTDRRSIYKRIAPRYDRLHRRWLRGAGASAQAALEGAVRALIGEYTRVLDVGCGTGHFARRLIAEGFAPAQMTLVDASGSMLKAAADLPLRRVKAGVEDLPFADDHFDIVTCAWVVETLESPEAAIRELCRVVKPGGSVCLVFCANEPADGIKGWVLRRMVELRGTGCFLDRRDLEMAFARAGWFELRWLPCDGPVGALIARCRYAGTRTKP